MKTYDFIFGLGNACSCTQTLREADLQVLSFPFDWVILSGADDLNPKDYDRMRRRELAWLKEAPNGRIRQ